jgi:deazaflavin-dependent oxidoreductase (nitroreductase family)
MTATQSGGGARLPLLGLRRRPGRLARAVMRTPQALYDRGWSWMFGHVFVSITYRGRTTGKRRQTVAMALAFDPATHEVIVCSAWGPDSEWLRNLHARPALHIMIGGESYAPEQRFLTEDESTAVAREFLRCHPWRSRLIAAVLGWGDLGTETALREFVRSHPFVAFAPPRTAFRNTSTTRS